MEVEVTVEGEDALIEATAALGAPFLEKISAAMESIGQEGKDLMDSLTPVATGYLKSRNSLEIEDMTITLGNDASYAGFVNYGTRFQSAQPFFEPATEYITQELSTAMPELLGA